MTDWPPPGIKWYYSDEAVAIAHGDCREILPQLTTPVDLVLTDPPYGIRYASNRIGPTTTAGWMNTIITGDDSTFLRDWTLDRFTEWACFGSLKTPPPNGTRETLIWDKGPASGMGDLSFPWKVSFELIHFAGSGWRGSRDEGVIKGYEIVTRASMGRCHPNEKPVSLLRYLITKHVGETILDPFAGSGTTGRAAKDLRRKAILIEIEEKYCAIAAKRMSQMVLL